MRTMANRKQCSGKGCAKNTKPKTKSSKANTVRRPAKKKTDRCSPQASYGKRPYRIALPNEPDPMCRYDALGCFYFEGTDECDPKDYRNYTEKSLAEFVATSMNRKTDIMTHKFRSVDTLVNWLEKNGFGTHEIVGGLYVFYWPGSDRETRESLARYRVTDHNAWAEGKVYNIAFEDDPSIPEPYATVEYIGDPRDLPERAIIVKDKEGNPAKFYGDEADIYIQREISQGMPTDRRKYIFDGTIYDLSYDQATALGMNRDLKLHNWGIFTGEMQGGMRSHGKIRRSKNIKRR